MALTLYASSVFACVGSAITELKTGHDTTGVITRFEHFVVGPGGHFTDDEGRTIAAQPGDEQWRVYFRIESFDGLSASARAEVFRHQQARHAVEYFSYNYPEWFRTKRPGDRIAVMYRYAGGGEIEILSIGERRSAH